MLKAAWWILIVWQVSTTTKICISFRKYGYIHLQYFDNGATNIYIHILGWLYNYFKITIKNEWWTHISKSTDWRFHISVAHFPWIRMYINEWQCLKMQWCVIMFHINLFKIHHPIILVHRQTIQQKMCHLVTNSVLKRSIARHQKELYCSAMSSWCLACP